MRFQFVAIAVLVAAGLVACDPIGEPTLSGNSGGGGAIVIGSSASSGKAGSAGTGAPMAPYVAENIQPMMQDPEAEAEEWTEEVWADNEAQAMRKCQAIAEGVTSSGSVTVVVGQPQALLRPKLDRDGKVTRSGRYVCRLKSEM